VTLAVGLNNFLTADDSRWKLLMTTGPIYAPPLSRDLLRLQALYVGRPDRRSGEECGLHSALSDSAVMPDGATSPASMLFLRIPWV
jgi:hypothetical protein